jgi:hypothetical protein
MFKIRININKSNILCQDQKVHLINLNILEV